MVCLEHQPFFSAEDHFAPKPCLFTIATSAIGPGGFAGISMESPRRGPKTAYEKGRQAPFPIGTELLKLGKNFGNYELRSPLAVVTPA
jgi:hypothetical protein